jgi:hypothetical protein
MAEEKKDKLVNFLNRRAFDPVLDASESDYSGAKKDKLKDVQQSTRAEKERFANYGSAAEVRRMFEDDLSSEPAKKVQRELKDLDLPTLPDVKEDFLELCERENVHA